ncbi:MAG: hypothetical protein LBB48_07420, partial [Treponema sp.]|nr:hypothetical protein [Treponema sp.]
LIRVVRQRISGEASGEDREEAEVHRQVSVDGGAAQGGRRRGSKVEHNGQGEREDQGSAWIYTRIQRDGGGGSVRERE